MIAETSREYIDLDGQEVSVGFYFTDSQPLVLHPVDVSQEYIPTEFEIVSVQSLDGVELIDDLNSEDFAEIEIELLRQRYF